MKPETIRDFTEDEIRPHNEIIIILRALHHRPSQDLGILADIETSDELVETIETIGLARDFHGNMFAVEIMKKLLED